MGPRYPGRKSRAHCTAQETGKPLLDKHKVSIGAGIASNSAGPFDDTGFQFFAALIILLIGWQVAKWVASLPEPEVVGIATKGAPEQVNGFPPVI